MRFLSSLYFALTEYEPTAVLTFLFRRWRETGSPDVPGHPGRHASRSGENRTHDRRRSDGDPQVRAENTRRSWCNKTPPLRFSDLSLSFLLSRIRGSSPSSCGSSPLNITSTPPPDTYSPGGKKVRVKSMSLTFSLCLCTVLSLGHTSSAHKRAIGSFLNGVKALF